MKDPGDGAYEKADEPAMSSPGEDLYHDLSSWRGQLARSIARNNIGMRSSRIGFFTNRVIFTLLILAIAEDRKILAPGTLRLFLSGDPRAYKNIIPALGDPWAGTGEEPKTGEPFPVIDPELVRTIAGRLLDPARPYNLAAIPPGSIAAILDRYLARTIRRSAAHQAIIVDRPDAGRPEIPATLAGYAAESTLSAAIDGRSPDDPLPLRAIDPACGAGRMLILALLFLKSRGGEPADLLRYTLHGADPDPHAVAAARVLLALSACEDGSRLKDLGTFSHGFCGYLGILTGTVRCGNALVGPEITDDESWAFCPARERHDIRPFSWKETFPEVLIPGGFDAVVSAPPENPVPAREWLRQYFQRHYTVYDPEAGLSAYVTEKSFAVLRPHGVAGIVCGRRWLHARSGTALRTLLLRRQPKEIVLSGDSSCFILVRNTRPARPFVVKNTGPAPASVERIREMPGFPVDPRALSDGGWPLRDTRKERLMETVSSGTTPLCGYVLGEIRYDPGTGPVPHGERGRDRIQFPPSPLPPRFMLSRRRAVFGPGTGVIPSGSRYLYGLLSSRLALFILSVLAEENGPGDTAGAAIARFPVRTPDFDNPLDAARHGRLEALVQEEQALARNLAHARPEREREAILRELDSVKKQIDSLVYGIYGLSVDEIAVVESFLS